MNPLRRLLRARSIAVVGGSEAEKSIMQCDRLGFDGEIWPVNPKQSQMAGRTCFASVNELPAVPEAAFIAVPRESTIQVVRQLADLGTSGVVCYASGFAEAGDEGVDLQQQLVEAAGSMALIGPNCYGVFNYLDGLALWPDESGGQRCNRGVAIISQSGNISINFTMQRRGLPLAYLISTGNMAGVKTHDYIHAMLEDEQVTAIGLYLEGITDAVALSEAAICALKKKKPIVILQSGHSDIGSQVTMTHSSSLSGQKEVNRAFFQTYGMLAVDTIPALLETLKFVSVIPPMEDNSIATISCSGGEAALMADLAEKYNLEFASFSDEQRKKLFEILGDRVVISNPLDYHTYIWGMQHQQQQCFQAVFEGNQAVTIKAFDYPDPAMCDPVTWDDTIVAVIHAKKETDANVALVASMHENTSESVQAQLLEHGIAPMLGMDECFQAAIASVGYAAHCRQVNSLQALSPVRTAQQYDIVALTEYQGKRELAKFGLRIPEGIECVTVDEIAQAAETLGFPMVVKASSTDIVHKTEASAVHLNLQSESDVRAAVESMQSIANRFLVERMETSPHLELFVGVRHDETFGFAMIIGAGGILVELVQDTTILLFPINKAGIRLALNRLKIGKLIDGYRGKQGNMKAVVAAIHAIASYVEANADTLAELDVNPLGIDSSGAIALDVHIRKFNTA